MQGEKKEILSELAIASLVVGIISFINLFNMEKSIVAIVFGILALRKMDKQAQLKSKNFAIFGITLGIISVIAAIIIAIKFWPQFQNLVKGLKRI